MLSKQQLQICNSMGINPHEFIELNSENLVGLAEQASLDEIEYQKRVQAAELAVMKFMNISPAEFKHIQAHNDDCKVTFEEMEVCEKMGVLPVDFLAEKMKNGGIYKSPYGRMEIKK